MQYFGTMYVAVAMIQYTHQCIEHNYVHNFLMVVIAHHVVPVCMYIFVALSIITLINVDNFLNTCC